MVDVVTLLLSCARRICVEGSVLGTLALMAFGSLACTVFWACEQIVCVIGFGQRIQWHITFIFIVCFSVSFRSFLYLFHRPSWTCANIPPDSATHYRLILHQHNKTPLTFSDFTWNPMRSVLGSQKSRVFSRSHSRFLSSVMRGRDWYLMICIIRGQQMVDLY